MIVFIGRLPVSNATIEQRLQLHIKYAAAVPQSLFFIARNASALNLLTSLICCNIERSKCNT